MKKWLSYILLALVCTFMVSCADESMVDGASGNGDKVTVQLRLSLPGGSSATYKSRAAGTNTGGGLDQNTDLQRYIAEDDIYVLVFDNESNELAYLIPDLTVTGEQGAVTRTLTGTMLRSEKEMRIVVLANLTQNGIRDAQNRLEGMVGKEEKEVYEALKYNYPGKWTLGKEGRFLPMWGTTEGTLIPNHNNLAASCSLYRGVAKMGVTVDEVCEKFTLKEIYVYYVNEEGYCAAPIEKPDEDEHTQYTQPDIPAGSAQRDVKFPVVYNDKDIEKNACLDKIYVSEVKNVLPLKEGKKQLKVVVGGIYNGEGLVDKDGISYYRIDMEDDATGKVAPFDIIRNHSYLFNITKVSNPGTPTPEEALDHIVAGLTVEVEDWVEEPMRSIPDQYTLTTSKSVVTFDNLPASDEVTVTTDYGLDFPDSGENGQWTIVTDEHSGTWFTATQNSDNKTITVTTTQNYGVLREGYFYVRSGNLEKQIIVSQDQPPTANCYVVGEGTHDLIVVIKGNGKRGLVAEKTTLDNDASLAPKTIGIIWETKAGLVTLIDGITGTEVSGSGRATYNDGVGSTGSIKYKVNIGGATIGGKSGGNALIGAFDGDSQLIWSWHIWVCPELDEDGMASHDQNWTLNEYWVMDRNLGALSNSPGVASLGLLYQWGRKDPFIGAAHTNDNFTGDGVLETVNYNNYNWGVMNNASSTTIDNTIKYPTKLTYSGLSQAIAIGAKRQYLWGSNEGLSTTVKDLGSKTIYDPCPEGYRVPPVDAFVFSCNRREPNSASSWKSVTSTTLTDVYIQWRTGTGRNDTETVYEYRSSVNPLYDRPNTDFISYRTRSISSGQSMKSSDKENWNENLKYIPHKVDGRSWQDQNQYIYNYSGGYVGYYDYGYIGTADYYGFYLNYKEIKEPITKYGSMYELIDYTDVAWLPLTGAYDPTKGFAFRQNGAMTQIEQGSSLTVNSFLWTNSSVNNGSNWIPAAMFLHGTETGGGGSGRHIHGMTQSNIKADPHYAGAVRCVRDVKKNFSGKNYLAASVTFGNAKEGSSKTATLRSVNDSWRVVDSGAAWLSVSPESGDFTKGKDATLTFKALKANDTGSQRSAKVLIKFESEAEPRAITVTQPKQ